MRELRKIIDEEQFIIDELKLKKYHTQEEKIKTTLINNFIVENKNKIEEENIELLRDANARKMFEIIFEKLIKNI